jgi:hypothetical protein
LKRAPEAKAAAQAKRATRKAARKEKRAAKKVGDISVLY